MLDLMEADPQTIRHTVIVHNHYNLQLLLRLSLQTESRHPPLNRHC